MNPTFAIEDRIRKTSLLVAAVVALMAGPASAANLVNNGSFETPDVTAGNNYVLYNTGSTGVTGWTVLGPTPIDAIHITPDTYQGLKGSDGHQWIDLTGIYGYDKGLLSDAIATAIGTKYHVSFDVGNYVPFGMATLGVAINGGAEQLFTNTSLAPTLTAPMNWASFGFDWVADSTSTRLSFVGRANGVLSNNGGIGLDNVSLTLLSSPAPEPSSWMLLLGGLGLVGALGRRRAQGGPDARDARGVAPSHGRLRRCA